MKTMLAVLMLFAWTMANAVEYKVVRCHWTTITPAKRTEILNKEALDGWRLVAVSAYKDGAEIDLYLVKEDGARP